MSTPDNIIFDWNQGNRHSPPLKRVELLDETLRDGIQCPSITDPPIEKKLEIFALDSIGVDEADIACLVPVNEPSRTAQRWWR